MPLSVTLRDSNHMRVRYIEDPGQVMLRMHQLARAAEKSSVATYTHLSAVDVYGDAIFNHLQVPALMREMELIASQIGNNSATDTFLKHFKEIAALVDEFSWYIHIIGD